MAKCEDCGAEIETGKTCRNCSTVKQSSAPLPVGPSYVTEEKPAPEAGAPSAAPVQRMGIVEEFILFLRENKAYWLAPIIIVLLLMVLLVVAGGTGAAPFIYTLF